MTDNARFTGPALERMYQFILWMVPTVEKFPRSQKFLLGDRMQTTAMDVLEGLIEATYTRSRARLLSEANIGIEKLRILFRIAFDLKYIDGRRYEHAARSLDEVGRLIGGSWNNKPRNLRSANRNRNTTDNRNNNNGFRVASTPLRPELSGPRSGWERNGVSRDGHDDLSPCLGRLGRHPVWRPAHRVPPLRLFGEAAKGGNVR